MLLWIWIERRARLLRTRRAAIGRCCLPARPTAANPRLRCKMGQTDRRTPYRYIDPAAYYAISVNMQGCDNRLRSTGRLSSEFHTVIITVYAWQLAAPQNAYCIRLMKLRSTVRIWAVSGAWTSISLLPCSRCWFMNGFHDRPVTCLCSSSSCTILTSPPCRKPTIKSFLFLGRDHFALHIVQILHLLRPGYE